MNHLCKKHCKKICVEHKTERNLIRLVWVIAVVSTVVILLGAV